MVSFNYFYLLMIIYLHIWLRVTNDYNNQQLLYHNYKRLLIQVTILNTNSLLIYGINYSCGIRIIFKRIYRIDRWDPNKYYHSGGE